MRSEFQDIELDQVRYSLVWEDFETLFSGLQYDQNDHVLIVTSGGCNVLNSLLRPVASVTSIDINPIQNSLLALKMHIIRDHDYATFASLLGLHGQNGVTEGWNKLKKTLSYEEAGLWEPYFQLQPEGLLLFGKLERYILSFRKLLDDEISSMLRKLVTFDSVTAQHKYFMNYLQRSTFRELFVNFFNEQNLSKGRDAKLFKYAEEPAGETFYQRLVSFIRTFLVKDNFYFRLFFFGLENLEFRLPACYQPENFETIKTNLHKIRIVRGEAIEYLLSENASNITKASLSNIFEYTSRSEFMAVCGELARRRPSLRFVYWNLLQEQIVREPETPFKPVFQHQNQSSCFYFKNACAMQIQKT